MDYKSLLHDLDKNGFTLIPGVLSANECQTYVNELERTYDNYSAKYADKVAGSTGLHNKALEKTVYNLHNKSGLWMQLFDHQVVHEIIGPLLQEGSYENSEPFYLNNISARTPLIGNPGQQIHVDSNLPGVNYSMMINALWYFEDSHEKNGATIVVPKTHTRREFAENGKQYADAEILEAKAGDLLIFNGNLWHGGGPCSVEGTRWAGIFGYARWFIKPSFDVNRNTPKVIYDSWSERQKRLMGFDLIAPIDEFSRTRRRSTDPEFIVDYCLPEQC